MKKLRVIMCLICGAMIFTTAQAQNKMTSTYPQNRNYSTYARKMAQLLDLINLYYVDTVNFDKLTEAGIVEVLKELDPHSVYISPEEVAAANEPLQGGFDGIGVSFQIIKDTINVIEVIVGGPSEKVGLMPGDKIVKVDSLDATGKQISNKWVQTHLRGKKGTKVPITVLRGRRGMLSFVITRDKIPMNSINVFCMLDSQTGYIRLERFAQNSNQEFIEAITKLKARGMENLIFDLRGNGGGYLNTAFNIADQFIKNGKMIVYTNNIHKNSESYRASSAGEFEKGKLIVLVDEGSASASEIVSGAVQDWDRGLIMGRRTFGKGLVQKPVELADKSQVRLTVSHYYTPTGRCIQKSYSDGLDSYFSDLQARSKHGEYFTADSIKFPDSLKFKTPQGRIVYGGGGIMPDIFIPLDTSKYSSLYAEFVRKGIVHGFIISYMEDHREALKEQYPTIEDFKNNFKVSDALYNDLVAYGKKEGVSDSVNFNFSARLNAFVAVNREKLDLLYRNLSDLSQTAALDSLMKTFVEKSYHEAEKLRNENRAPEFIKEYLKFEIARNIFNYGEAYQLFLMTDDVCQKALEAMHDDKLFKKFKVLSK
ncbi:MAG: S41 family peptidase [Bacteroidales bacterium]|nr:S41 family peptidase [Bacteroidales bacterium]